MTGPQHLGRYWRFRERLARFAVAGGEAVVLGPGIRLAAPGARRVVCAGSSSLVSLTPFHLELIYEIEK